MKKNNVKKHIKVNIDNKKIELSTELKTALWTVGIVLVVLVSFYFIANGMSDYNKEEEKEEESIIQFTEILAGSSFNREDKKYIVVYFDMDDVDSDDTSTLTSAVTGYHDPEDSTALYTCDLSKSFNKKYITDKEVNRSPKDISELSINGPTLIRFEDGNVKEYITGAKEIEKYLVGDLENNE